MYNVFYVPALKEKSVAQKIMNYNNNLKVHVFESKEIKLQDGKEIAAGKCLFSS